MKSKAETFADKLVTPFARATMTLVSIECSIAAWMLDRAVFHHPNWKGAVSAIEKRLGLNHETFDDVVINRYSHMGRPKNKLTLAAAMLGALPLTLPAMVGGQLSYFVFKIGLGKKFATPMGKGPEKSFLKCVKANHGIQDKTGPIWKNPKAFLHLENSDDQLQRYVRADGSDFEPTPEIQQRMNEWNLRKMDKLTTLRRIAQPDERGKSQIDLARRKIKHVVIIMQENHTFDDYFGKLLAEGPEGNGDPNIPPIGSKEPMHLDGTPLYPIDDPPKYLFAWWPTHGSWSYLYQKFMAVHEYHDPSQTPVTSYFARNYAGLRHFHEFQRGPSHVNHLVQIAATAGGLFDNFHSGIVRWIRQDPVLPPLDVETITHRLEYAGKSWANYGNGVLSYGIKDLKNSPNNLPVGQFVEDARAGKLRDVSYIVPPAFSLNEHSPDTVIDGQLWLNELIQSVVDGGRWNDTAFIIGYDDWGGYKQHNDPPLTMLWKDELPNAPDPDRPYGLGDEVAAMIVSPYAKPGYLFKDQHIEAGRHRSYASIPAFLEAIYGVDPLTRHDATADNLLDAFDFLQKPLAPPPATIPSPVVVPDVEVRGKSESSVAPRTAATLVTATRAPIRDQIG